MAHVVRALALLALLVAPVAPALAGSDRPGPPPGASSHGHGHARPAPRPTAHPVARPRPPAPRRVVVVERPTVRFRVPIGFDPWAQPVMPAPRSGWVWVDGGPDAFGGWHPGTWRPYDSRAGYVWESGYWSGFQYVDGYWRPVERASWAWEGGHYEGRHWSAGRWVRR